MDVLAVSDAVFNRVSDGVGGLLVLALIGLLVSIDLVPSRSRRRLVLLALALALAAGGVVVARFAVLAG